MQSRRFHGRCGEDSCSDHRGFAIAVIGLSVLLVVGAGSILFIAPAIAQTVPAAMNPAATTAEPGGSRFSRTAESEVRFQQGLLRYNSGQLALAEADFKGLVAADAGDSEAWYFLGLSQLDQQRPQDAVTSLDQSLRLDGQPYEVHAARARALIQLDRFPEAKQELDYLHTNPQFRSLEEYLRGQMLSRQGDLDGAAAAFARAKALGGTEAETAEFYEGLTYLRMRQLVRARETFRESRDARRDSVIADASRQLDAVLTMQDPSSKNWEGQVTLSYEYDSNVLQLGNGVPTPDGISGKSDSRIVLTPRGSYSFIRNDRMEIGLEGNGYFAWQFELSDFDIASYQLGPFINYKVRENLFASARYNFNYVDVGHDPFLTRNVITPQLTVIERDFGYTSIFYQFQTRDFNDAPATPPLDRDGTVHTLGVVQGINLPPLFRDVGPAQLEVNLRIDDQITDGTDFDAIFYAIGATIYSPLPFWKLRADLGFNFEYDAYENGNSLDANGDKRKDYELNVVAGLTRQLTKDLALRIDYTFTNNESNVETSTGFRPYQYDRSQLGLRLIYSF